MSTQSQLERRASARLANGEALRIVTEIISRAGRLLALRILERAYRRAAKKLMKLDERTLSDIGLNRSEINSVVRHTAQERRGCPEVC